MRTINLFIAHLPSGYIFAKKLQKKLIEKNILWRYFLIVCLIGAITPDFDLIYFYIWDNRAQHHHTYWSHWSIIWFSALFITGFCYQYWLKHHILIYSLCFIACGCLHLLLDTIAGDIWCGASFLDDPISIVHVPAKLSPWWLNFLTH